MNAPYEGLRHRYGISIALRKLPLIAIGLIMIAFSGIAMIFAQGFEK